MYSKWLLLCDNTGTIKSLSVELLYQWMTVKGFKKCCIAGAMDG
jgi:hypothetical protein